MSKPVSIGFSFANQTGPIPLSQVDSDFNSLAAAINDFGTYGSYLVDSSGTANLITLTTGSGLTFSYAAGVTLNIQVGNTNTSATVYINVNGLGNRQLYTANGSTPPIGSLITGGIISVLMDTNGFFRLMGSGGSSGSTNTTFATVVTAGSGLAGNYSSPQLLLETAQYGIGVDAGGSVLFKNTNNGAYNFYNSAGTVQTVGISNVGMNIQSSAGGAALTLGGTAGYSTCSINAATTTNQSFGLQIDAGTSTSDFAFRINNAIASTAFLNVNGVGGTSLAATAGITFVVSGVSGQNAQKIIAPTSTNNSFGLYLQAGTNSSDYALYCANAFGAATLFRVNGDGGCVVGGPTGGSLGAGTLNASGLYINGVSVGTSSGGVTSITAGTGISVNASTGAVTITASGAGVASAAAGTGISVSASTGAVTFTNTGVTSAAAGTGIGVSASTGAVTFTNSGVTSVAGSGGLTVSGSTGAVTFGLLNTQNFTTLTTTTLQIAGISVYGNIPQSSSTTAATTDRNQCIVATGTITVPNSTFNSGDTFSIYNNSGSAITISAGVTTMRLAGTATTGSRTLAGRGMATVWFVSGTECVVNGAGVT